MAEATAAPPAAPVGRPVGRVAILAGGGQLPLMIAGSVRSRGGHVDIVAIAGEADAAVANYPHTWINLGQASRMMRALKGSADIPGPNVMVIAGAVTRPDLTKIRPDLGLFRLFGQVLRLITAGGDDALLTRAIRIFENQGLTVVGVQDVAPELLISAGVHGGVKPDAAAERDIALAGAVLRTLGPLDIGQGCVAADGKILAIEGAEGTDRMLGRLAKLPPKRSAVLLKAPKPRQERRVDLPTIGLHTVHAAKAAGVRGIAVVAGEAIGLQWADMIAQANLEGMFIAGLPAASPDADAGPPVFDGIICCGRYQPSAKDLADVLRGGETVQRLATFATGEAAAVVRGHVLGVSAIEGPLGLLERVSTLGQWGLHRLRRQRGACVVRLDAAPSTAALAPLFDRVAAAGFAGIGLVTTSPAELPSSLIRHADAQKLFLIAVKPQRPTLVSHAG